MSGGEVKLLGVLTSPYKFRVEVALKLKGIPYQYIEEDLSKKSPLLLQSNPIHNKIPVLIHNGKPISESLVILEYIEDTWKNNNSNPLLPIDPLARSTARFWIKFIEETILQTAAKSVKTKDRGDIERIIGQVGEQLKMLEKELVGSGEDYFGGERIGLLDIVAFAMAYWFDVIQEAMAVEDSLKLMTEDRVPELLKWMRKVMAVDVVVDSLPPRDKHIAYVRTRRMIST
ncbi:unnamed protein product [Linum trigynum]|uniref:Glutathione S-transferase n=1 Tax=Linum trigynum TaxID=586398 RepID=A0AAV2EE10_9ROSI